MTLPTMYGWIVQIYEYSPGVVKAREKVPSVSSAGDAKVPPLPPIRCGLSSSFFHVTVVPAVTVRAGGKNLKFSILTVAALAAVAATLIAVSPAGTSVRLASDSKPSVTAPNNTG